MFDILDNLSYIVFVIGKFVKNFKYQFLLVILIFTIDKLYKNYFSVSAVNKNFEKTYFSYLSEVSTAYEVMKKGFIVFTGDTVKPSEFFTELAHANIKMLENDFFKNHVKFIRIVINEKPSTSLQFTDDINQNQKIKNKMKTKDLEKRFSLEKARRDMFLVKNPKNVNINIFYSDGLNQDGYEENIKNFPDQIISIRVDKEVILDNWRGQIIIVKNMRTNSYLMFREIGGEQSQNLEKSKKTKMLVYYGIIENKFDINDVDENFYNLMIQFDLFKRL